jgi:hypothetical protein
MRSCTLCAAPLDEAQPSCPRCGLAATLPGSRRSRAGRLLSAVAGFALVVSVAIPAARAWRTVGCEPRSWIDWHVAIRKACLTPAYVCENMTSAKMLDDPQLVDELRSALKQGEPAAFEHLDALVAHLRAAYGCESATGDVSGTHPSPASPRLPPGHPPIPEGQRTPLFEAPPALTI